MKKCFVISKYTFKYSIRVDYLLVIVSRRYADLTGADLFYYEIATRDLRDFAATERDHLRGIMRLPPLNVRS